MFSDEVTRKLRSAEEEAFPWLPQGLLQPRLPDDIFFDNCSIEDLITYVLIKEKPEKERTRRERKFLDAFDERRWRMK